MMKKPYFTLAAVLLGIQFAQAQWTPSGTNIYNSNTGYVGIGTTSPAYNLDVNGTVNSSGTLRLSNTGSLIDGTGTSTLFKNIIFGNGSTNTFWAVEGSSPSFGSTNDVDFGTQQNFNLRFIANNAVKMSILSSGNVGIGTSNPTQKLQISGSSVTTDTQWLVLVDPQKNNGSASSLLLGQSAGIPAIQVGANNNLSIQPTGGNVLIGKISQANSAYLLDVAGSIRSNQVVVNTTGADFVFDPAYRLYSLSKVKRYIDQNHHLPGIPPAKEMQKEGLNVGDNQVKLLQKIEELTLYLIEKDKKEKDQGAEIKRQQTNYRHLEEVTAQLAKRLALLENHKKIKAKP